MGIGAHRSGTTWLYRMLVAHPAVAVPPERRKEVHYFGPFWERDPSAEELERYHGYFPRPDGQLAGEWTPRYMSDPWTPRLLAAAAPQARLLVLLRDPVARFVSHLGTHLGRGPDRPQAGAGVAGVALARSLYLTQLRGVLEHFSRDRLLVLQFERCVGDPEGELRRAYEFLGLDTDFVPPDTREPVNVGGSIDLPAAVLRDVAYVLTPDARELARSFPEIDLSLWPGLSKHA